MRSREPVISINELGREREFLQKSPRDHKVARYIADSSNSSYSIIEHKLRSPHSQTVGLSLLHGAVHLLTVEMFLLGLFLSIMAHCITSSLQMIFRVMIIYQSCSGKKIVLRYKLLSTPEIHIPQSHFLPHTSFPGQQSRGLCANRVGNIENISCEL